MNTTKQKAQLARFNRMLAYYLTKIVTSRGGRERHALGQFHMVHTHRNRVVRTHINLDEFKLEFPEWFA